MWPYIVRRIAVGLALILALTLVTLVLLVPVDPARYACGKNCSEQQRDQARKALGYDQPVMTQWTNFVKGVAVGRDFPADPELVPPRPEVVTHCAAPCLGYSHLNSATVNDLIKDAAPISIRWRSSPW